MFTAVSMRSAHIYRSVDMETSVSEASPHQLIGLLFQALLQSLAAARGAILNGEVAAKSRSINRAIRILDEGLKAGLDVIRGGDLAINLGGLYDYCILAAAEANSHNDAAKLDEVIRLIQPIADSWGQIKGDAAVSFYQS